MQSSVTALFHIEAVPGWLQVTESVVKIVALATGGVWTYYRFIKGRTYSPRLETAVAASAVQRDGNVYVVAKLTVKNTGNVKIDVKHEGSGLRLFSCDLDIGATTHGEPRWTRLVTLPVLRHHGWIESSESIQDELLYVVRADSTAVKLEFRLCAKGKEWNAETFVTLPKSEGSRTASGGRTQ
jgi:hypothetical protein